MGRFRFEKPDEVIDFFARCISEEGTPGYGGPEEEMHVLEGFDAGSEHAGKPINNERYARFLTIAVNEIPEGREILAQSASARAMLVNNGHIKLSIGNVNPETSRALLEIAHAPQYSTWDIEVQSRTFARAVMTAAEHEGLVVFAAGALPTTSFRDFLTSNSLVDLKDGSPWYDWMMKGKHPELCGMVIGTASVHHNLGFNDPERMTRYMKATLRAQPTMLALFGNSPLWNGNIQTRGNRNVLSYRGLVQLANRDLSYPDFLLDPFTKFGDVARGYMSRPLGRTFVDDGVVRQIGLKKVSGEEVECHNLTMLGYLNGFDYDGARFHPDENALHMMLHDAIVDVRPSMIEHPRVEPRLFDCIGQPGASISDAIHRGWEANLDEFEDLMYGVTPSHIRWQREQVCYHGLQTPVQHRNDRIKTQRDLALEVLRIAGQGLCQRGKNEQLFLLPALSMAVTGENPAQRMIKIWRECDGDMRRFYRQISYFKDGRDESASAHGEAIPPSFQSPLSPIQAVM